MTALFTYYSLVLVSVMVDPPAENGLLAVVSVEPAARSLHAQVQSDIVITFDQPINRDSVTPDRFWAFGRWSGTADGVITFENNDHTVRLDPSRDFSAGEQVMVILSHDLQGATGAPMRGGGYCFQFWTRARPSSMYFTLADTLDTNLDAFESSRPYGGVASDVNGDGWLDISSINEDTADVRVFLNTADGLGTFAPFLQPTTPVNVQASPSEPSDFNRDGHVDLCVANIGTGSVSVLLGNGDGTFAPQQEITVGENPRGIAVLDADGDGDIDIVNTNYLSDNLSLMLNDGTGVFGAPMFFEGGGAGERALAAGDMNHDGLLDLVASAYDDSDIMVITANGDGTFTHAFSQAASGRTWMLVLGDVDGDGDEDVGGVNVSPTSQGVLLKGSGSGRLSTAHTYGTDVFPLATDFGDLDGDGDLDWVTSSFSGDWFLFANDGLGNYAFDREFLAPANASCSLPFDLDNDGDLDLALIDEIADVIQIYINSGHALPGDTNEDSLVNVTDLLNLLANWGSCFRCSADFNGDDEVNVTDLLVLLANWG